MPIKSLVQRAFVSGLYEQNKQLDTDLQARRKQMDAAKRMVRELKGKEQAIKWGIVRNDKKEVQKIDKLTQQEHIEYYEEIRRQFIEFIQSKRVEDKQTKSIWFKEVSIEKRIKRLQQMASDRLLIVERFREDLENAQWKQHLQAEQLISQQIMRQDYLERLADEKAFKEEMAVMQKIVEVEERQRRRKQDIEFEELQILKEQQEVMKNIELLMKCYGKK